MTDDCQLLLIAGTQLQLQRAYLISTPLHADYWYALNRCLKVIYDNRTREEAQRLLNLYMYKEINDIQAMRYRRFISAPMPFDFNGEITRTENILLQRKDELAAGDKKTAKRIMEPILWDLTLLIYKYMPEAQYDIIKCRVTPIIDYILNNAR